MSHYLYTNRTDIVSCYFFLSERRQNRNSRPVSSSISLLELQFREDGSFTEEYGGEDDLLQGTFVWGTPYTSLKFVTPKVTCLRRWLRDVTNEKELKLFRILVKQCCVTINRRDGVATCKMSGKWIRRWMNVFLKVKHFTLRTSWSRNETSIELSQIMKNREVTLQLKSPMLRVKW